MLQMNYHVPESLLDLSYHSASPLALVSWAQFRGRFVVEVVVVAAAASVVVAASVVASVVVVVVELEVIGM